MPTKVPTELLLFLQENFQVKCLALSDILLTTGYSILIYWAHAFEIYSKFFLEAPINYEGTRNFSLFFLLTFSNMELASGAKVDEFLKIPGL